MAINSLHEALVNYLMTQGPGSGTPPGGIVWKANATAAGSPYYKQVPAPAPYFPYVVFDVPKSQFGRNIDGGEGLNSEGGREDLYAGIIVKVVGEEASMPDSLWSPYVSGSVFYLLDSLVNNSSALNGTNFKVNAWRPQGIELAYDNNWGPDAAKVLIAEGTYDASVLFNAIN